MTLGDVLYYRKPESGSAGLLRARFIDAVEALEYPRQMLFGNSYTCVGYAEQRGRTRIFAAVLSGVGDQLHIDLSARMIVADRIVDQIVNKLGKLRRRALETALVALERNSHLMPLCADVKHIDALAAD